MFERNEVIKDRIDENLLYVVRIPDFSSATRIIYCWHLGIHLVHQQNYCLIYWLMFISRQLFINILIPVIAVIILCEWFISGSFPCTCMLINAVTSQSM